MSASFDSRVTPVRDDLAAAHLKETVERPRYSDGTLAQVVVAASALRFSPSETARLESELLFGERFTVYDSAGGWAWGQAERDGYVGYVRADGLGQEIAVASHVVNVPASHLYPEPDLKALPVSRLSFESQVRVEETRDDFCRIAGGGWLFTKHLLPAGSLDEDYVQSAQKFLGVPYLWGGRTAMGLDCSALVQLVLLRAGIEAPRDSDLQARSVGNPVDEPYDLANLQYGDLIFFLGHVGFVLDGWRFLHANAFDMQVSVQSLSDVLDRAKRADAGMTAVRRIWSERDRRQQAR